MSACSGKLHPMSCICPEPPTSVVFPHVGVRPLDE